MTFVPGMCILDAKRNRRLNHEKGKGHAWLKMFIYLPVKNLKINLETIAQKLDPDKQK